MSRKFLHFVLLAALVAASSLALAQDAPGRVGRVSSVEGQVTLRTDGDEDNGALLNWPVTSSQHLTTARGGRAEFRVGAAAVRLDGDSDLEVVELDDDSLRLRLNYGSASVRVRAPEMVGDFELTTPQARIVLTEPGVVRVDTDRAPDTTTVSVFAGTAQVNGAGTLLTVRAGKRADVRGDDVSTGLARTDRFDEWAQSRDRRDDAAIATRYIPNDVTGYEELDHYGTWTENAEYGPLWTPRVLAADWAPYRDGRWTWIEPWGWTWVDNAPWGYAPSHYGRWVIVNRRWYWAPGRFVGRPVWAPALVGWVGGANWSVTFGNRYNGPGIGWYPLTPRDRYVPSYRVSHDHERRLGWTYRGNEQRWRDRDHDGRRDGVTVLPQQRFDRRHTVQVDRNQRWTPPATAVRNAPLVTAPTPGARPNSLDRNRDGVPDYAQRDRNRDGIADIQQRDRNRDGMPDVQQRDRNRDGVPDYAQRDRNRDGIADIQQRDRNRDGVPDVQQRDRNHDGVPDSAQRDRNRDGVPDRHVITTRDRNGDGQPYRPPVVNAPPRADGSQPGRMMTVPPSRDMNSGFAGDRPRPAPRDINGDGRPDRTPFDRNGDGIRDGDERRDFGRREQRTLQTAPPVVHAQPQPQPQAAAPQPPAQPVAPVRSAEQGYAVNERREQLMEARRAREERRAQSQPGFQPPQAAPQPAPQAAPPGQEQQGQGPQRHDRRRGDRGDNER